MIMTPAGAKRFAERDAQDALRALASMPGSRGEILRRPPSIFAGDTMRASLAHAPPAAAAAARADGPTAPA